MKTTNLIIRCYSIFTLEERVRSPLAVRSLSHLRNIGSTSLASARYILILY
ncbi:hypothetical protein [Nodularia sp. UHCC 0506]|uniref:hypothetical protein n=1 Tax=Nodularia sp. UHCC 0506 TaxID=3110243 RepID=UPI002B20428C|nr:hypothetical protein [Nodularia sp. UHCC 0506]MEA5515674.1 hypothetical protein [Nodularia sp. UHCC 0506]